MNLSRRGLLAGIIAAAAAPVIIRTPGLLMPIKPLRQGRFTREELEHAMAAAFEFYTRGSRPWTPYSAYELGDVVEYGDYSWKAISAHVSTTRRA